MSRLPAGAQRAFAAQVGVHLLVRHCPAGCDVRVAMGDGLNDEQLLQHVTDAAVVWEPIEPTAPAAATAER